MSARVTPRSLKCRLEAACRSNAESPAGAEQLDPNQGPEILADQTRRWFFLAGQNLDVEAGKLDAQVRSRSKRLRLSRIGRFPARLRECPRQTRRITIAPDLVAKKIC